MKIFQQSQEREDLQKIEEAAFADDCKEQFTEKSLAATNGAKVKIHQFWLTKFVKAERLLNDFESG